MVSLSEDFHAGSDPSESKKQTPSAEKKFRKYGFFGGKSLAFVAISARSDPAPFRLVPGMSRGLNGRSGKMQENTTNECI